MPATTRSPRWGAQRLAVKTIRGGLVVNEMLLERFPREAEAVAKLRHPNVVPIYSIGGPPDAHPAAACLAILPEPIVQKGMVNPAWVAKPFMLPSPARVHHQPELENPY